MSKQFEQLTLAIKNHNKTCLCSVCCCAEYWSDEDEKRALEGEKGRPMSATDQRDYDVTNRIINNEIRVQKARNITTKRDYTDINDPTHNEPIDIAIKEVFGGRLN